MINDIIKCLKIVEKISDEGGCDTVGIYLACVMKDNPEAYEQVLNSRIHGKKVKDII